MNEEMLTPVTALPSSALIGQSDSILCSDWMLPALILTAVSRATTNSLPSPGT